MTISIIIPIYNIEAYIAECAESILSQRYENMEIIFVDDCCTDKSMEVLQQVLEKFPEKKSCVQIIHHPQNLGLSAARNTGTQHATGTYIMYVDGDDIITSNAIISFLHIVQEHHEPTMVMGGFQTFGEQDPWNGKYKCKAIILNNRNYIFKAYRNDEINIMAWNKLIKREFLIRNNISFAEGIWHEDIIWNICIANHIDSIVSFTETTYLYRIRPQSLTTDKDEIKQADGNISYLKVWNQLFQMGKIPRDKKNIEFFNAKKLIELKKITRQTHLDEATKAHYISEIFQLDYSKKSLLKNSKRFWWKALYFLYLWLQTKKA